MWFSSACLHPPDFPDVLPIAALILASGGREVSGAEKAVPSSVHPTLLQPVILPISATTQVAAADLEKQTCPWSCSAVPAGTPTHPGRAELSTVACGPKDARACSELGSSWQQGRLGIPSSPRASRSFWQPSMAGTGFSRGLIESTQRANSGVQKRKWKGVLFYHWLLPFHPLSSREFPPRRFRASQNESGSVPLQIHRKCRNWETNSPRPRPQLGSAPGRKKGMITPTQLRTPCLSLSLWKRRWTRVCQGTTHTSRSI